MLEVDMECRCGIFFVRINGILNNETIFKMNNEVLKPLSIARAEFISSLTDLINNCKLPSFVIEAVLKDMYNDVRILSQRQLEMDMKKYNEQLNGVEESQ